MAVQGFGTSTEEMEKAGNHVLSVNQSVQSDLASLRVKLEPLAGVAWKGLAAIEFRKLMERWDADARLLNEALRSIGESIGGSARSYYQQEDEQVVGLSSIRSVLG